MNARDHLEADWPNPRHWCFYCGANRGRQLLEGFFEMSTRARALRCRDLRGCLARQAANRRARTAA